MDLYNGEHFKNRIPTYLVTSTLNFTAMDQNDVNGFYAEIAAVCAKYRMEGFVGMWFHGPSDIYGFMNSENFGELTPANKACKGIATMLEQWADSIAPTPNVGYVRAFTIPSKK
jgi:hypothetical protein